MSLLKKTAIAVLVSLLVCTTINVCFAKDRTIKIGLAQNLTRVSLVSSSPVKVGDSKGRNLKMGRSISATISEKKIIINGKKMTPPIRINYSNAISFRGKKYLGSCKIIVVKNRMVLINDIKLEEYLRGVLKMEVNPNWPMEALKAQAIISRTYALKHAGRHRSMGYDLCASPHCQAYRGVNAHDKTTDRAIKATEGLILTYAGKPANTFFHSDSGGRTASSESVWGGRIPYLRSVKEAVSYKCPYSDWQIKLSSKKIEDCLAKKKIYIGKVTDLKVKKKDSSGRVALIEIRGSRGKKELTGNAFRMIIGSRTLKSTMFKLKKSNLNGNYKKRSITPKVTRNIEIAENLTPEEETQLLIMTKQGLFSPDDIIDMLSNPHSRRKYLVKGLSKKNITQAPKNYTGISGPRDSFTLTGHGWGHGVGLSQWGARALAKEGWNAKKILYNYYPGTKVAKLK